MDHATIPSKTISVLIPENTSLDGDNYPLALRKTDPRKNPRNVLNVKVSCFDSYLDTTPKTTHLLDWLTSDQYAHKIIALRGIKDKAKRDRIKATLPAITVSGIFNPSRKEEHLVQHSGLICIDIDRKGNEHISNFSELKFQLFKFQNVAYAGLSASGKGCYLIIPIAYPKQHKAHFRVLRKDLADWGVHIDTAPQNVASLRGYSYDPEALFRYDALPYSNLALPRKAKPKRRPQRIVTTHSGSSTRERVETLIDQIVTNGSTLPVPNRSDFGLPARWQMNLERAEEAISTISASSTPPTKAMKPTGNTITP